MPPVQAVSPDTGGLKAADSPPQVLSREAAGCAGFLQLGFALGYDLSWFSTSHERADENQRGQDRPPDAADTA